jgi:hypothetical protein
LMTLSFPIQCSVGIYVIDAQSCHNISKDKKIGCNPH